MGSFPFTSEMMYKVPGIWDTLLVKETTKVVCSISPTRHQDLFDICCCIAACCCCIALPISCNSHQSSVTLLAELPQSWFAELGSLII